METEVEEARAPLKETGSLLFVFMTWWTSATVPIPLSCVTAAELAAMRGG